MRILTAGGSVLSKEPNLIKVDGKVTIFGDIHGQFYDMLNIFDSDPVRWDKEFNSKLVFLGDYIDRGSFGVEVFLLLLALKQRYPSDVFLLRGNHESRSLTEHYGFRDQCLDAYDEEFYDYVMQICDQLPLSAVVNGQYFCVHGGISQSLTSLEAVN